MAARKKVQAEPVRETAKKKPETKTLKALRPLLYDGLVIRTGQEIPFTGDKVDEWIKDGSAAWV